MKKASKLICVFLLGCLITATVLVPRAESDDPWWMPLLTWCANFSWQLVEDHKEDPDAHPGKEDIYLQYVETEPAYMWPYTQGSWTDWTLDFLPQEAKYVDLVIEAYCNQAVGARKNGSTLSRIVDRDNDAPNSEPGGVCSTHLVVEPDENGIIEVFVSLGDTVVWIGGYWKGPREATCTPALQTCQENADCPEGKACLEAEEGFKVCAREGEGCQDEMCANPDQLPPGASCPIMSTCCSGSCHLIHISGAYDGLYCY